jgi:hypothetical protein
MCIYILVEDYSFVNTDEGVLLHFQLSNFHESMHLYQFLLAIQINNQRDYLDDTHSNELLRAFYDQNEFVRDNEMVVLVDRGEEKVVDQLHLKTIKDE